MITTADALFGRMGQHHLLSRQKTELWTGRDMTFIPVGPDLTKFTAEYK